MSLLGGEADAPMQETLEGFFKALRANDVKVTPAEAIDAHAAAELAGYTDRALFRDALAATLAKSAAEVDRFESVFDTYFRRSAFDAFEAPEPIPEEAMASDLAQLLLGGDSNAIAQAMEAAAQAANVQSIRLPTQRPRFARRMLEEMGVEALDRLIGELRGQGETQGALADRLAERRKALAAETSDFVQRQHELYAKDAGRRLRDEALAQKQLTAVDDKDMAAMQSLVRRLAKKLADRYSRRRRRARRGALDVRRTLRKSMGYGGIPFDIVWKTQKIDKPKLVVLVDVSKSVAAAAQFLLMFCYSLNEVVDRLDSFAFSGRLVPVGDIMDAEQVDGAIVEVLKRIGFQQSDYGRAFKDFAEGHMDVLDRHTTVIILGDGRNNYGEAHVEVLKAMQERARAIVWLNPEPEAYWGVGDSEMDRYSRFCHVAKSCNTLKGLERIIEDVLRKYLPH